MLVVSRKVGERVLIGDNIAVTVVKLNHGGVRIGIEAPPEMPVVREELALKLAEGQTRFPSLATGPQGGQRPRGRPASHGCLGPR